MFMLDTFILNIFNSQINSEIDSNTDISFIQNTRLCSSLLGLSSILLYILLAIYSALNWCVVLGRIYYKEL